MKRLVICCDGTWQSALQDGPATNVQHMMEMLAPEAVLPDGKVLPQIVHYDAGVGSEHDHWIGGVTGRGVRHNIKEAYLFIMNNYVPGDALYFIGFSRGAFTVRSLAGFIYNCGILKKDQHDTEAVLKHFDIYKSTDWVHHPDNKRQLFPHDDRYFDVPMQLFVFDTVKALGWRGKFLKGRVSDYAFHDDRLNRDIIKARHALAIDECRADFAPSVWTLKADEQRDSQQAWFVGDHSDIGGGHPESENALSRITLAWMMDQSDLAWFTDKRGHYLSKATQVRIHDAFQDTGWVERLAYRYKGRYRRHVCEALHSTQPCAWRDTVLSDQARHYIRTHPHYHPKAHLDDALIV